MYLCLSFVQRVAALNRSPEHENTTTPPLEKCTDESLQESGDEGSGFDPYWFAVILTINMQIGLITPPVGLNLYVINGIVPDISLPTILKGALPFMLCMVLLCAFPLIATWLLNALMGPAI